MKVEEFRNLSDDQLREKANECLANVDDLRYAALHAAKLLQAQLYMNEINTRNDEKIAERDEKMAGRSYKLEIWVIILIGLELLIGLGGIAIGCREGNQQVGVLQEMKKSTAATATLLQGQSSVLNTMNASASATATAMDKLQKAQDASLTAQRNSLVTLRNTLKSIGRMNDALDQELNLAFAVAINVTVDNATKHMTLANLAKTSVYVWVRSLETKLPVSFQMKDLSRRVEATFSFLTMCTNWPRYRCLELSKTSSLGVICTERGRTGVRDAWFLAREMGKGRVELLSHDDGSKAGELACGNSIGGRWRFDLDSCAYRITDPQLYSRFE